MTAHDHAAPVYGCFRCDLNSDEAHDANLDVLTEAASEMREYAARGMAWDGDYAADKGWLAPEVALKVADWLETEASTYHLVNRLALQSGHASDHAICFIDAAALAVARTYLGEDA